jgi:hypothetical protein
MLPPVGAGRPRPRYSGGQLLVSGALLSILLSIANPITATPVHVRRPCDFVVSYFLYPYQGSRLQQFQWRIFDPARGVDTLFLSLAGEFGAVRWDTTYKNVYFRSGDSLYRAAWRVGSLPHVISKLPTGRGDDSWWFNPDRQCWQLLRILGETESDHPYYARYWGELWQASRDGSSWRRLKVDSLDCADEDCQKWNWSDGTRLGRESPAVTMDSLASETRYSSWGSRIVPIDTSTVRLVTGEGVSPEWYFLRSESFPRRGVVFSFEYPDVIGPYYWVDLEQRKKTLIPMRLDDTEDGTESLLAEHCGIALMPGPRGSPLVIDGRSGRVLFSPPWNSTGAVWVHSPR